MRVNGISNNGISLMFGRKPTKKEEPFIKNTMENAYNFIGADERAVIMHGSCFPAVDRNSFIGSPVGKGSEKVISLLSLYGFNGIQLGPCGELEKGETSPYKASAFSKNRLFIDLQELTTDKYGRILSLETYENITFPQSNTDKNYEKTNFQAAGITYNIALNEAYNKFKVNLSKAQPEAMKLDLEFNEFLKKHEDRLIDEGVFKVLSDMYGTDDYYAWEEQDHHLLALVDNGDYSAVLRYQDIIQLNKNKIDKYKFEQFLITKQLKENKEFRDEIGFKYINDLLVGCSKMDAWRYEDAFLDDWEMGARENHTVSQRWGIKVLDPKKLFRSKTELNIAGEFLKEKIEFALEFCENLRVDHVMGLIEPYLMSKSAKDEEFVTYPPSNKNKNIEKYISELRNPENPAEEYDKYWDYPTLLERLVIPTFEEHGISKDLPVWEDICSYPDRFKQVYSALALPRISNIDWERVDDAMKYGAENNWFVISTHDNIQTLNYPDRIGMLRDGSEGKYTKEQPAWSPEYLSEYLNMDDSRKNIKQIRAELAEKFKNDEKSLVFGKFSELLTTPKFQISFDDLFGIIDKDAVYNIPGSDDDNNWKTRLTSDFEEKYYQNLASDNPTALNMPELLKDSVQAKMDMLVKQNNYDTEYKTEIYKTVQPILNNLEKAATILKE